MKIVFTGGGTGGHFYPLIAVAEEIDRIVEREKIIRPNLYYLAPTPYDERLLFEHNIAYRSVSSGKWRPYFSLLNFIDVFKIGWGVFKAIITVFTIYPDVVFGKGGYASFPTLMAARILNIPVIIHESDAIPGKVNRWAGKFATRIAVSYREAAQYFPEAKVAYTGQPVRRELTTPLREGAREFLKLEETSPVIFVFGGSQGSAAMNNALIETLPRLLEKYQVIHQTGEKNFHDVQETVSVTLKNNPNKDRYRPFPYLNLLSLRMVAGVVSLVVSRAGSALFEVASWGTPTIVIPIPQEISHDQTANAFAYARTGAAHVIEEKNLTPTVLFFEISRIMDNQATRDKMSEAAKNMIREDAAEKIAKEILSMTLAHEA